MALGFWWLTVRADRQMRGQLLDQTRLVAAAVDLRQVLALSGTASEVGSPEYQRLKAQLTAVAAANPKCRFVYLMGRNADGVLFFFADSEPMESEDYLPPGSFYEEATPEEVGVFETMSPLAMGPFVNRWGTWVAAQVPLADPRTGKPIAVLGMDIDARAWGWEVAARAAAPISLLGVLVVLVAVFVRKNRALEAQQGALRESEEEHRLMTQHAISAIAVHEIVLDEAGRPVDYVFLSANPAFEIHTGLKPSDVIGRRVTEVLPGIEKSPFIGIYGKVVLTGAPASFDQYCEPLGRHYSVNAYKLGGRRFATVFSDISERKRAEETLARTAARLTLAARAGGVGIWDYDLASNDLEWDDGMFALYGVARKDFSRAYEAWQAGVHPDDRERSDREVQMAVRGERDLATEFRVVWPDGTTRNIQALGTVLRDGAGNPVRMIGTNWDITDERKRMEEFRRTIEELQLFNQLATNRELVMIELKQQINSLCSRLGYPPAYDLHDLLPSSPSGRKPDNT